MIAGARFISRGVGAIFCTACFVPAALGAPHASSDKRLNLKNTILPKHDSYFSKANSLQEM
jgi:hypothetical protein